jgi:micrococcal nuclease
VKRVGVCVLLATLGCARPGLAFAARVIGVGDGDTMTVLSGGKDRIRIRLSGIDAPELGQAFGRRAKEYTSSLVYGRDVAVHPEERDRFGRLVARVFVDGRDVAREIVAAGLAWHSKRFNSDTALAGAEASARKARLGLWRDAYPIPPWRYRARQPSTRWRPQ